MKTWDHREKAIKFCCHMSERRGLHRQTLLRPGLRAQSTSPVWTENTWRIVPQLSSFLWLFSVRATFLISFSHLHCYYRASEFALLSRCKRLLEKFKVVDCQSHSATSSHNRELLSAADVLHTIAHLSQRLLLSLFFYVHPRRSGESDCRICLQNAWLISLSAQLPQMT